MKILITGGCGFLGSNLASDALLNGDDVLVFDNLSRFGSSKNLEWLNKQGKLTFQYGDIRNFNDIKRAVSLFNPDVVYHLAGQVAMTTSIENPRLDFEINVQGTINLLESVRNLSTDILVIYSSSNKVYGDLESFTYKEEETRYECLSALNGFDESLKINFHSPYGCSKGAADQYVLDYAKTFGMSTIVFRHSSMYGGRQFSTYDQGWVGWFCQVALQRARDNKAEPFTISGTGKQVRDLLHASDMKKLYRLAILNSDKAKGQVFNIGGGSKNSLSILELINVLERRLNLRLNYKKIDFRFGDQKYFVADICKAKRILGWEPEVSNEDGISGLIEWIDEII
jgi:CDP-paratose 2-epimerase